MLFVLATNSVHTSEELCDYLGDRLAEGDEVHAINALPGGDATSSEEAREGENALAAVEDALRTADGVAVETHQYIRGNQPADDVLGYADEVDADEFVIGIRKRSPTGKALFGSVAQDILLGAEIPLRVVPRSEN